MRAPLLIYSVYIPQTMSTVGVLVDLEALEKNKLSMKREDLMIKYKSFLLITLVYCSLIGVHLQFLSLQCQGRYVDW